MLVVVAVCRVVTSPVVVVVCSSCLLIALRILERGNAPKSRAKVWASISVWVIMSRGG